MADFTDIYEMIYRRSKIQYPDVLIKAAIHATIANCLPGYAWTWLQVLTRLQNKKVYYKKLKTKPFSQPPKSGSIAVDDISDAAQKEALERRLLTFMQKIEDNRRGKDREYDKKQKERIAFLQRNPLVEFEMPIGKLSDSDRYKEEERCY